MVSRARWFRSLLTSSQIYKRITLSDLKSLWGQLKEYNGLYQWTGKGIRGSDGNEGESWNWLTKDWSDEIKYQ